jgi:hypothetical protein
MVHKWKIGKSRPDLNANRQRILDGAVRAAHETRPPRILPDLGMRSCLRSAARCPPDSRDGGATKCSALGSAMEHGLD